MALSKSFIPHLSLVLCNVVWACDFPLYSLVLGHYVSPLAMVAASLVVASLLSFVPLIWEKPESVEPSDRMKIFAAAMLIGVVRKLCLMYGLVKTSPIDGAIISTTTPLLVLIFSAILGGEHITRQKAVGLLLGMGGAIAIVLFGESHTHAQSTMLGNLIILLGSCVSAIYMVCFKSLVAKYRISTLLRWIYTISAILMFPLGAHDIVTTNFKAMQGVVVWAVLFVLIVPTYLPNLLLNYSLRFVAPTITSIYAYIQPIVATILAVAMGLDRIHLDTIIFAVIIFVGVGLVISAYGAKKG